MPPLLDQGPTSFGASTRTPATWSLVRPKRRSSGAASSCSMLLEGAAADEVLGATAEWTPQSSQEAPDDLLLLDDLNDFDLLRALWRRYERKQIYTWVGSVLVSVNPYRDVGAFSTEMTIRYASSTPPKSPHLYAAAMRALADDGKRHALLITGESGAGKTEATRGVLNFLAARHTSTHHIRDRLQSSTPVLAAFGNAQTRQNTNSSRFGKFMEVHLSADGEVVGATLRPYMLEASRVAGNLPSGERTYHVFYLLREALNALAKGSAPAGPFWARMAHAPEWSELIRIGGPALAASARLDNGPPETQCLEGFESLVEGLIGTGMRHVEVAECCRLVTVVALLADWDSTTCSQKACAMHAIVAPLLRMAESDISTFLTRVETSVGGACQERYVRARNEREVTTLRASLAQELYATLFSWLTKRVARGMAPPRKHNGARTLGLLDLYGFEVFNTNGFEQFLINYCNERMQQFFNRQVFACEAEEYEAEGFDCDGQWRRMMAALQLPALALLEGEPNGTPGLFGVINDRSRCSFDESNEKGDKGLGDAITIVCSKHPAFCRASKDPSRVFGVRHFAGEVFYETAQFVRKNASAHRPDIVEFLRASASTFVCELLSGDGEAQATVGAEEEEEDQLAKSVSHGQPGGVRSARPRRKLFGRTLISVFQQELNELSATLEARVCHHVRCLRPNDDQAPLVFDDVSMLRQCRYSGLLEATRIRRQGYAHRRPLRTFAARYAMLLGTQEARTFARHVPMASAQMECTRICEAAALSGMPTDSYRIGHTKVFLREQGLVWLETVRSRMAASIITGMMKGNLFRRRYLRQQARRAAVAMRLQANIRGHLARRHLRPILAAARAAHAARTALAEQRAAEKLAAEAAAELAAATQAAEEEFAANRAARRSTAAAAATMPLAQAEKAPMPMLLGSAANGAGSTSGSKHDDACKHQCLHPSSEELKQEEVTVVKRTAGKKDSEGKSSRPRKESPQHHQNENSSKNRGTSVARFRTAPAPQQRAVSHTTPQTAHRQVRQDAGCTPVQHVQGKLVTQGRGGPLREISSPVISDRDISVLRPHRYTVQRSQSARSPRQLLSVVSPPPTARSPLCGSFRPFRMADSLALSPRGGRGPSPQRGPGGLLFGGIRTAAEDGQRVAPGAAAPASLVQPCCSLGQDLGRSVRSTGALPLGGQWSWQPVPSAVHAPPQVPLPSAGHTCHAPAVPLGGIATAKPVAAVITATLAPSCRVPYHPAATPVPVGAVAPVGALAPVGTAPQRHATVMHVGTPRVSQLRTVPASVSSQPSVSSPPLAASQAVARSMSGNLSYIPAPALSTSVVVPSNTAGGVEGTLRSFAPLPAAQLGVADVHPGIPAMGSPVAVAREVQQFVAPVVMPSPQTPLTTVMGSPLLSARDVEVVGMAPRCSFMDHFDV